jgi:argininosuccinate lyase
MTGRTRKERRQPAAPGLLRGHFATASDEIMSRINASIEFDRHLYAQDLAASRAHCSMLVATGIIPAKDGHAILKGLDRIETEIESGAFRFTPELEDIHMHVEARLTELIGDAGRRLHTARSRNDQVATDFRLWVRDAIDTLDAALAAYQLALVDRADEHAATVMPGFTHLQAAQPVTLGHHLLAYFEMADRDRQRLSDCRRRLNVSPLGAGALAGTSFPIDRHMTARALGFAAPAANSMDAVADRDFVLEFLSALAICAVHLSRLAEEIVLWSSVQFGFIRLPDSLTTGSSMMPQKRNPDAAELVRAKTGRIAASLSSLMMVMKGLPLTYSKDMQEDKEPAFDAVASTAQGLEAMTAMVRHMSVDATAMRRAAGAGYTTATDLADWLVRELALPFRRAYEITGRLVRKAEEQGIGLEDMPLAAMQAEESRITAGVYGVLGVERSVASRSSLGGTAPKRVRAAVRAARRRLARGRRRR